MHAALCASENSQPRLENLRESWLFCWLFLAVIEITARKQRWKLTRTASLLRPAGVVSGVAEAGIFVAFDPWRRRLGAGRRLGILDGLGVGLNRRVVDLPT